ncbi:hypothetical protein AKJ09_10014 [Labilithrix luteola]|uniref:Uncharacterized protein n=1 Tax=Labilithrix luteola TaxID=1391654 RepID=A0A0K1QC41_9BACT|nr:hypothetical protein [Labilithrix luteola]AKV03351.1 hypothetical protein AKJ09_10014 [Labilithrix luteola]
MISTDRDSGGFVNVTLDGEAKLVHEGQYLVRDLKGALGVKGSLTQHVGGHAHALADDDPLLVVGGESFSTR